MPILTYDSLMGSAQRKNNFPLASVLNLTFYTHLRKENIFKTIISNTTWNHELVLAEGENVVLNVKFPESSRQFCHTK